MALKAACSLVMLGGAQAVLSADCLNAVQALHNQDTAAGDFNADSPKCILPDATQFGTATWSEDADGAIFTTREAADPVCSPLIVTGNMSMCSDPCQSNLANAQVSCAGQTPAVGDEATLPLDATDNSTTLVYWINWFNVMNQVDTLCKNACLQYYCDNAGSVGFEALTPACSTTTTTVTETGTMTAEASTMAPVAPTTAVSTMAPVPQTTAAPVTQTTQPDGVVTAPLGSMPADLQAAQAVGSQDASAALSTGLLNSYSRLQVVHPGWFVGALGAAAAAAVAFFVTKRRTSVPTEELETLAPSE